MSPLYLLGPSLRSFDWRLGGIRKPSSSRSRVWLDALDLRGLVERGPRSPAVRLRGDPIAAPLGPTPPSISVNTLAAASSSPDC